ncbi:MAG TPA: transglutaminase domain-containing protein [Candidatus Saccharimonadia bacterium]|nr:transglutaminase domain-containing protein [Candidatus Saccharimonadia bacterium]
MLDIENEANRIISSNTNNLEKVKELCSLLISVPYKRIGSLNPEDMLKIGKGSCTPKHVFLARELQKLGIPIKFLMIPFYYKNMPFAYRKNIITEVKDMPLSHHVALKAFLNGKWRILDVTWDKDLKGFPLNTDWDGKNDMKLAVIPENIQESEADPRIFEKEKLKHYTANEEQARKNFYKVFDELLEEVRKRSV